MSFELIGRVNDLKDEFRTQNSELKTRGVCDGRGAFHDCCEDAPKGRPAIDNDSGVERLERVEKTLSA